MAYITLALDAAERSKYTKRKGLEGPFWFAGGRVLYYDTKMGQYWDPKTDFYVPSDEVDHLQNEMMRMMRQSGG